MFLVIENVHFVKKNHQVFIEDNNVKLRYLSFKKEKFRFEDFFNSSNSSTRDLYVRLRIFFCKKIRIYNIHFLRKNGCKTIFALY